MVGSKVAGYRLQAATYAVQLERITGQPVIGCRFLFIGSERVIEADLPDLDEAKAAVVSSRGD